MLYLGCNVSGYFSIQNKMAYFLKLCGTLLYWLVTSNIKITVSGSVLRCIEFKYEYHISRSFISYIVMVVVDYLGFFFYCW